MNVKKAFGVDKESINTNCFYRVAIKDKSFKADTKMYAAITAALFEGIVFTTIVFPMRAYFLYDLKHRHEKKYMVFYYLIW